MVPTAVALALLVLVISPSFGSPIPRRFIEVSPVEMIVGCVVALGIYGSPQNFRAVPRLSLGVDPNCPPHPYPVGLPTPLPDGIQSALTQLEQQLKNDVNSTSVVNLAHVHENDLYFYFSLLHPAWYCSQYGVHGEGDLDSGVWSEEQDWTARTS